LSKVAEVWRISQEEQKKRQEEQEEQEEGQEEKFQQANYGAGPNQISFLY